MPVENQNKIGFKVIKGFKEYITIINENRETIGLKALPTLTSSLKPLKTENLSVGGFKVTLGNQTKTDLLEVMSDMRDYCQRVTDSNGGITRTALEVYYRPADIEHAIQDKLLVRQSDGRLK